MTVKVPVETLIWHRIRRGHWPDFIFLQNDKGALLECMVCDREPPSRGRFVPVLGGLR